MVAIKSKNLLTVFWLVCVCLLLVTPFSSNAQGDDEISDKGTEIHVKDADIGAIIKIFSKKTKRNYILDEKVKGKVSIFLPSKVSDTEAIRILDAILALKGFTAVPVGENIWKIVDAKDAKKTTIPTYLDVPEETSATVVTRIVNLKYVGAEDAQKLLSQLISAEGLINSYGRSNSLLIIDYADNISRIEEIIRAIDIPSTDTDLTIIPIVHADAKEVSETVKEILGSNSESEDSESTRPVDIIRNRLRRAANQANNAESSGGNDNATVAARDQAAKIIPDERTNSIILVADATDTERIRALISRLDSPVDLSSDRFYVYRCQHASAEELADVLSGLTGGSSSSSNSSLGSSTSTTSSSLSTGGLSSTQQRLSAQRRTPGSSRNTNTRTGASSVNLGEDIAITADPATNSLIIASSKTDYEKILELLKQLDIKRRQVLVEALLLEVGLTDSTTLGTEFAASGGGADGGVFASSNFGNLASLLSDPTSLANFSLAAASSGTLTLPGDIVIPSQTLLISAAESNTNANILSAPNILTTDNEEAEIVVGQNVPFLASQSTSSDNLNNTFNQVDRQDVGITLRLTPQISSGDFVTLRIFTEVSNVVDATANSPLGPTTTIRTSETTVITKSGQMIAIGGLISDDTSSSDTGIPFLKDIPIFGSLFKLNTEAVRQTNLLIFITPKIIKDQFDARDSTLSYRNKLEDKIEYEGLYPSRSDVLHRDSLDNVAEPFIYGGEKPTTIRPPQDPRDGKQFSKIDADSISARGDQKIRLKASPKLPDEIKTKPKFRLKTKAEPQFYNGSVFVALKALSDASTTNLPFSYERGAILGVVVPPGSSESAKNFFRPGESYAYSIDETNLEFEVIEIFEKETEALEKTSLPRNSWRTLTAYEIMSLGQGPWIKQ